jgi:hypothetical protein
MSAREEIETNRLLGSLVDTEFDRLVDDDGDEIKIKSDGSAQTSDQITQQLLIQILNELRIMNLHLANITDETFACEDIR